MKDKDKNMIKGNKLYNINVDCNSKKGKMLIEVVEKESSLNRNK